MNNVTYGILNDRIRKQDKVNDILSQDDIISYWTYLNTREIDVEEYVHLRNYIVNVYPQSDENWTTTTIDDLDAHIVKLLCEYIGIKRGDVASDGDIKAKIGKLARETMCELYIPSFMVAQDFIKRMKSGGTWYSSQLARYTELYFTTVHETLTEQIQLEDEGNERRKTLLETYKTKIEKEYLPSIAQSDPSSIQNESNTYSVWFEELHPRGFIGNRDSILDALKKEGIISVTDWTSKIVNKSTFNTFINGIQSEKRGKDRGNISGSTIAAVLDGKKTYLEWATNDSDERKVNKRLTFLDTPRHFNRIQWTSLYDYWMNTYASQSEYKHFIRNMIENSDESTETNTYTGQSILKIIYPYRTLQEWITTLYPDGVNMTKNVTPNSFSNIRVTSKKIPVSASMFNKDHISYDDFIRVLETVAAQSRDSEAKTYTYTDIINMLNQRLHPKLPKDHKRHSGHKEKDSGDDDEEQDEFVCHLPFVIFDNWIKEYRGSLYPLFNQAINVYEENISESLLESDVVNWLHTTHCPLGTMLRDLFTNC